MTQFYEKLADAYEDVFPLSEAQVNFVESNLPEPPAKVIDLGCSTGALARVLARIGYDVLGIDLSCRMIAQAEAAIATMDVRGSIAFAVADMRELIQASPSVDALLCLGNTLVHLTDQRDLLAFLEHASRTLRPSGKFIIQIVNYDRVQSQNVRELPPIQGRAGSRLQRFYSPRSDGLLDFATILTAPDGRADESVVVLLPLLKSGLEQMLLRSGFTSLKFYGSYQGTQWEEDSFHTICVAEK